MFAKIRGKNRDDEKEFPSSSEPIIKYLNPKILLIDLKDSSEDVLRAEGYNVSVGSFGTPYHVRKSDEFDPVVINGNLPSNFAEQEIIVVDLMYNTPLESRGEKHTSSGVADWWASCSNGIVDPRPRLMVETQAEWARILSHNGVFVIFAAPRIQQNLKLASLWVYGSLTHEELYYNNWSLIPSLSDINTIEYSGGEIKVESPQSDVGRCLLEYSTETDIYCTLHPRTEDMDKAWTSFAENKYGDCVAGGYATNAKDGWGLVYIFPQIKDKAGFLVEFFKEVLPNFQPRLFPDIEGKKWVRRSEYELPEIIRIQARIEEIRDKAEQEILALQEDVNRERERMRFLPDLLRETDRPLVAAVKTALETIGFREVVDVDEGIAKSDETGEKREDLQIHDNSPVLLVEVKGIIGKPKDEDALAVQKYIAPRMQEWKRFDIKGLTIINHQRHIPALERENDTLFRDVQITNAKRSKLGFLTTWDLYRLVRSYLKNGWQFEHIVDLFYQNGRIEPIPTHYKYLGVIEHYFPKPEAVVVKLLEDDIGLGDRIAFELPVEFEEQVVESLQEEDKSVERVKVGGFAGIKTHLNKDQARKGVRVFLVS